MASIPNPLSFQGVFTGAIVATGSIPRPGERPERSVASALEPKNDKPRPGPKPARSFASVIRQEIPKMEIHNLARLTDDPDQDLPNYLEAHFNPSELKETIKVVWNDKVIPGLSHSRLQYSHTENVGYTFDLHFDSLQVLDPKNPNGLRGFDDVKGISFARNFLQSLCYPSEAGSVQAGAPPRVLFYWPGFISLHCVIGEQSWSYSNMASAGKRLLPRRMTCSMSLREIRDVRLLSGQVLRSGTRRAPHPSGKKEE